VTDLLRPDLAGYVDLVRRLVQAGTPGRLLLALHEAHRSFGGADESVIGVLIQELNTDRRTIASVLAVYEELRKPTETARTVKVCKGVNCLQRGADRSRPRYFEMLSSLGVSLEIVEPTCLDQCHHGPSLRVGNLIYCATDDEVVVDQRTWRADLKPIVPKVADPG
jgi:NADH:ubiquinone oxidoreductase subunit E